MVIKGSLINQNAFMSVKFAPRLQHNEPKSIKAFAPASGVAGALRIIFLKVYKSGVLMHNTKSFILP